MSVTLDGTEQVVYVTPYQYAAGTKVVATGYVLAPGQEQPPAVSTITGRIRVNSLTGAVVGSFTATLNGADAVKFAFSGSGGGPPVPAVKLVLTVQATTATGAVVNGNMDVQVLGA